jgi:hypothetical protein
MIAYSGAVPVTATNSRRKLMIKVLFILFILLAIPVTAHGAPLANEVDHQYYFPLVITPHHA